MGILPKKHLRGHLRDSLVVHRLLIGKTITYTNASKQNFGISKCKQKRGDNYGREKISSKSRTYTGTQVFGSMKQEFFRRAYGQCFLASRRHYRIRIQRCGRNGYLIVRSIGWVAITILKCMDHLARRIEAKAMQSYGCLWENCNRPDIIKYFQKSLAISAGLLYNTITLLI